MPLLTAGYLTSLADLARVWHAAELGGSAAYLLIRRDLRAGPPPAHASVDLVKYRPAVRIDCRRYAASCGQNPASVVRGPGRPNGPTTVKSIFTVTPSSRSQVITPNSRSPISRLGYLRPASLTMTTISMGPPITRATSPLAI
jgi:hypothetical protein